MGSLDDQGLSMKKFFPSCQTTVFRWRKYRSLKEMIFHRDFFSLFETKREVSQYPCTAESLKQWYEHYTEICESGHNKENNLSKCHMEHNEKNLDIWKFIRLFFFQVFE